MCAGQAVVGDEGRDVNSTVFGWAGWVGRRGGRRKKLGGGRGGAYHVMSLIATHSFSSMSATATVSVSARITMNATHMSSFR